MSTFKDDVEVYECLGGIFVRALEHPEVSPKLRKAGLRMRVDYSEPDSTILVDYTDGTVTTGDDAKVEDWDVALAMSADDGHVFWMGNLNFTVAMTKGRIRTKGSITELLKLLPVAKPLFATYEELLTTAGRDDLLAITK